MKRVLLVVLGLVAVAAIFGGADDDEATKKRVIPPPAKVTPPPAKTIASKPAPPSKGDEMRAKLQTAMSTLESSPCTSVLRFEYSSRFGGRRKWWLTCDGCAGVDANKIFPKELLRIADDMSIDNRVNLRDMYESIGQCH